MKNKSAKTITVNSFFAGIGGFDLGFEKAGATVLSQCEINPFGNSVLEAHWPSVLKFKDIKEVDASKVPDADIWCGGFPCQDVSVARGHMKRDGLKGKNTGLFFPFAALLEQRRPRVVLLENVVGLLSSHGGRDFHTVLETLKDLGYGVAWRVLNSRYFGVPQSRPRIYICAWLGSTQNAVDSLYEDQAVPMPVNERKAFITEATVVSVDSDPPRVPKMGYCLAATSGRHTGTDWSRTYVSYASRVRRMTPLECERLQGFDDDWTLINLRNVTADDVDTMRYHALGNAVSVPVVAWIAKRITKQLVTSIKATSSKLSDDESLGKNIAAIGRSLIKEIDWPEKTIDGHVWKNGGAVTSTKVIQGDASPSALKSVETQFGSIVETKEISPRYFLSANAATGILRRVDGQKRTLFKPLREALEALAKSVRIEKPVAKKISLEIEPQIREAA